MILLIFLSVATLGLGGSLPVKRLITFEVSCPESLITATPDIPGPDERAYIVINNYYSFVFLEII